MLEQHLIAKTRPEANEENIIRFGALRVTLLGERLVRVEESADGTYCDDATQRVWFRDAPPVTHQTELLHDGRCRITTGSICLAIGSDISRMTVRLLDGREVTLMDGAGTEDLPGTYRTLDNCNGSLWMPFDRDITRSGRISLTDAIVSKDGVAVLDDSTSLLLTKEGRVAPRGHEERDLYLFAYGHDYRAAIRGLYRICGGTPLIPRFALGNWWSRYYAYTDREYLELMDSFADRGIPFTVATVDMDWHPHYNLPRGEDGWTGYSWNRELFPDYKAFLQALKERNLHITLNLHPAQGVRWFEDQYEEMAGRVGIDPASEAPVAFDMTNDDFINAYFEVLHKPYEHDGVDFWWIDWQQGTGSALAGLDPLWSLNHYHYLDIGKEKEALILSRYAGVGSHRYPLGFSGDTHITWETMKYMPYFTASATNVGYTWWSHDIGGHMLGYKDNELYVRFLQFGVFSPVSRLHSTDNRLVSKDPECFGGGAGLIAKRFLQLRHAMLPFLYTASVETAGEGKALIEPMYYAWPEEQEAYECPGQYLFGGSLIAAPVTKPTGPEGMATQAVWLPKGEWTDVFTGDVYVGGGWQDMTRELESFPLLAAAGSFFVLDGTRQETNEVRLPGALRVLFFSGTGEYVLIEDGEAGERARTRFSACRRDGVDEIRITAEDAESILPKRSLRLELRNVADGEVSVLCGGEEVPARVRRFAGYTLVEVAHFAAGQTLVVRARDRMGEREKWLEALSRIITRLEMDNGDKQRLFADLEKALTADAFEGALSMWTLPDAYRDRLLEVVGR